MNKLIAAAVAFLCLLSTVRADTIILRDGQSYSGTTQGAAEINFTDTQGIQYRFPRRDVQSLVLNPTLDSVTLRSGKSYSGRYTGAKPVAFTGSDGIQFEFPFRDIESIVFSESGHYVAPPADAKVIPPGTEIAVRTDETIDSSNSRTGQLYRGAITEPVADAAGGTAIPAGTLAQLLIRDISKGGAIHSVDTSSVDENSGRGVGKNRRTAEFVGGGTAIGALLGGIFGGGKGAGIGALSGAGGGMLTQVFTRGRQVRVPAESVLRFELQRTLVLRPAP
jgi:hypothetical protein